MPMPSRGTHPAAKIKAITAASTELSPRPRALYISATGTIDITNFDGTTEAAIPVFAGTTLAYQPFKITAISVAGSVYGLYDGS